jgi:hypothetical protein
MSLQHRPSCLGDRHPRRRRRHVEDRALVERRHELVAEPRIRRHRQSPPSRGRADDDGPAVPVTTKRTTGVYPAISQEPVDRVLLLAADPAADEQHRERRRQRHREHRRERHRVGLRERERLEEAPLGALEGEHRDERHGDDEQREEDRRADLLHRATTITSRAIARPAGMLPVLESLVDVLDQDDRGVDHRADRDRDAAEGHDVRREPLVDPSA